jgi:hypothetical protein
MKDYRQRNNYMIEYQCLNAAGMVIKSGKIRAKQKASEFEALAGTENHLKSKIPGMVKMVCVKIEIDFDFGGSGMDWFNTILKGR